MVKKKTFKIVNWRHNSWFITGYYDKVSYENYNPLMYIDYNDKEDKYSISNGLIKEKDVTPELMEFTNGALTYIEKRYPKGQGYYEFNKEGE